MNIVHIAPNSPYNDGWGYQENLLPKYHHKLGHQVTLIVSDQMFREGKIVMSDETRYMSRSGFEVIRGHYHKYISKKVTKLISRINVYDILCQLEADFVFYHGLISCTIFDVIRYKKNRIRQGKYCVIVQDNHLDYNIGMPSQNLKQILLRAYYRMINKLSQDSIDKIYGVTPWRKKYAEEYFRINPKKTEILLMGADDEQIDFIHKDSIRKKIRSIYEISEQDFLIVSGGKIDQKKNILELMEAVSRIENVKLLLFGNVDENILEEFEKIIFKSSNVMFIGWIPSDEIYNYYFASDLVLFPGQHSVLWEQACASKVPCVFMRWNGMEHVNNGGNSDFIDDPTSETIFSKIKELLYSDKYFQMLQVASSQATDIYLYSNIAQATIEFVEHKMKDELKQKL